MIRLPGKTLGFAGVTACLLVVGARPGRGEETPPDPSALLRVVERASASVEERGAAAEALAAAAVVPDVDRAVRAAAALVGSLPTTAGRLARAALDAGFVRLETRRMLAAAARTRLAAEEDAARRWDLAAVLALVGDRDAVAAQPPGAAPSPFALEVLRRDAPELAIADTRPDADAWARHATVAAHLDAATEDDPAVSVPGLDALRAAGAAAVPLLVATAAPTSPATPAGRVPRRVRAVVALGTMGDASAVPTLVACLADTQDGWVRAAAAAALGDLGDARALVPLCRVLFYLGDRHRPHDGWEYPGASNTDVPFEAWADVAYHAIDSAAADALLRLGVRGAAEWLVEERLDPRTGRWRIRVTQDAVDAIRRAFPDAPAYEPDAGYPQRQASVDALRAWWAAGPPLRAPLDETRAAVRTELDALAASVGGAGVQVMDLQIAKRSAVLLGAAMTPSVLRVLATSKRKVQRAELALVLGGLRDRRAVAPLLGLTRDPVPAVRANAAEALAAYVDPARPGLLANTSDATPDAVVARWIELLDDAEPGPRASAVKALTSVPPSARVVEALDAHARRPENDFGDYRLAEQVARLVHAGTGLAEVVALLDDVDLFRRRFVWELLHVALRLDPRSFDPSVDVGTPGRRPPDAAALGHALARRRGA